MGFGWQEIDKTLDLGYIRVAGLHRECKPAVLFEPPNFRPRTMTHKYIRTRKYVPCTDTRSTVLLYYASTSILLHMYAGIQGCILYGHGNVRMYIQYVRTAVVCNVHVLYVPQYPVVLLSCVLYTRFFFRGGHFAPLPPPPLKVALPP